MELEYIPVNLEDIFKQCVKLIQNEAEQKSLSLDYSFESEVGRNLYCDPTRIKQIIINLLNNAVKFTPSGTVKLKISVVDRRREECFYEM